MPLQGGLPPAGAPTGAVVEIACDESGFSGTNLLDPATPSTCSCSSRRTRPVLVRTKRRYRPDRQAWELFFQARDALVRGGLGAAADDVLGGLEPGRVWAVLTRLGDDDRSIPPPLEPMLPALAETVLSWSAGRWQVLVIHDEQSALTADRLHRLKQTLAAGAAIPPTDADDARPPLVGVSPLIGLIMVDSRDDPRVQVADLLAGAARRLVGAARRSPEIVDEDPLQPFIAPTSLRDPGR